MNPTNIKLMKVEQPRKDCPLLCVNLTDDTMHERMQKCIQQMKRNNIQQLIVYGDVEHGSNFEYLVGYIPRFEEALLIIKDTGKTSLVLGNENLNKASKARIDNQSVHVPLFSLPHQPNRKDMTLEELLCDAGIERLKTTGIVGWKLFTSPIENNSMMFDVPHYIVQTIYKIVEDRKMVINKTDLFIGENGIRITNNANEVAHYEYGAALASDCMLEAMNHLDVGMQEDELASYLEKKGQRRSVVTIAASGERYVQGNIYPTNKQIQLADPISMTVGYRGGLSSRSGYAIMSKTDLASDKQNYLDELVIPYFNAYATWLNKIRIGMRGKELYQIIEQVLPKEKFNWTLCPGHLTAEEEWLTSPIYEDSNEIIQSGMIFQVDIIPTLEGYAGTGAESTIVIADELLRNDIMNQYPEMYKRMQERVFYMQHELGLEISHDVLPMCSTVGYLRPYLLNRNQAMGFEKE